jgi:hypothetical protein
MLNSLRKLVSQRRRRVEVLLKELCEIVAFTSSV